MVLQHEYQHNETMLQTLQLKQGEPYTPLARLEPAPRPASPPAPGEMVRFPGGLVEIGTDDRSAAYDNERPAHTVDLAPFWIDVHPVTNRDFLVFIAAGGYETRAYWSEAGWRWRHDAGAIAPKYWEHRGDVWITRGMDRSGPVDPHHPVCHVSWYEAEAFARWAGKRLPTESGVGGGRLLGPGRGRGPPLSVGRRAAGPDPRQRRPARHSAPRRWAAIRGASRRSAATA